MYLYRVCHMVVCYDGASLMSGGVWWRHPTRWLLVTHYRPAPVSQCTAAENMMGMPEFMMDTKHETCHPTRWLLVTHKRSAAAAWECHNVQCTAETCLKSSLMKTREIHVQIDTCLKLFTFLIVNVSDSQTASSSNSSPTLYFYLYLYLHLCEHIDVGLGRCMQHM